MKASKIVIVTAEHHPYHKLWLKLAERISDALKVPLEVRMEDYVYLVEYGDKDEFGMSWVPQILVELEDRAVHCLLSRLPLDSRLQPDEGKAIEEMLEKLKSLNIEIQQSTQSG